MKNELNAPILQVFLDKRWQQFKRVVKMQLEKKRGKEDKNRIQWLTAARSHVSSDT